MLNKKKSLIAKSITILGLGLVISSTAMAEANRVELLMQHGLTYASAYVAKEKGLFEKHALALGIENPSLELKMAGDAKTVLESYGLSSLEKPTNKQPVWQYTKPTAAQIEAARNTKTGSLRIAFIGTPAAILASDRTNGGISTIASAGYVPIYGNTYNPMLKKLSDIDNSEKIGMPSCGSSVQFFFMQLALAKTFGYEYYNALDDNCVSMQHNAAYKIMMNGANDAKQEITTHFTTPPFSYNEIKNGKGAIRKMVSSYDFLGGKSSLVNYIGLTEELTLYPTTHKAFVNAIKEAMDFIKANPVETAEIYLKATGGKENVDDVVSILRNPEIEYSITPRGYGHYAEFMYRVGYLNKKPKSWKQYMTPELAKTNGS